MFINFIVFSQLKSKSLTHLDRIQPQINVSNETPSEVIFGIFLRLMAFMFINISTMGFCDLNGD